jgi:lipopolysaccharide export system protein LptA
MISIESDSQQSDNKTGIVTATGNVRIVYPDRGMVATSRQAQYFSREGRLVLSGDVDVIDHDGQRIRADRLVYRTDSERLQADPPQGRQVYSKLRIQQRPTPGQGPGQGAVPGNTAPTAAPTTRPR